MAAEGEWEGKEGIHTRKSHWASGDFSLVKTVEESHFDFRRLFTGALRFGAGDAAIISTSPSGFSAAAPPRAADLVRVIIPLSGWRLGRGLAGVCSWGGGWLLVLRVLCY